MAGDRLRPQQGRTNPEIREQAITAALFARLEATARRIGNWQLAVKLEPWQTRWFQPKNEAVSRFSAALLHGMVSE